MMDLHSLASSMISAVNPMVSVTLKRSSGYTTQDDGTQVPTYTTVSGVSVQTQSLTFQDLQKLDGMNIQGVRRAIYIGQEVEAVLRIGQQGGDLIVFPDGTLPEGNVWLAAQVLEAWPDWRKVAITLQADSSDD